MINPLGSLMPSRDQIIADSKSAADLFDRAATYDPELAKQLTVKPLLASKTVWGMAVTAIITPVVAHYGLGLDQGTVELISGVVVVVVAAGLRSITAGAISGVTKVPK